MLGFPFTIVGRTAGSHEELVSLFRRDAATGPLRMQDLHPADAWGEEMERTPALRDAVESVLVELIATETDPKVLAMITYLGPQVTGLFPETAARRVLDGPPLPEGPGVQSASIALDIQMQGQRVRDPEVRRKLADGSGPIERLEMRLDERTVALVDAFEQAVASGVEMPKSVAERVGMQVAAYFPDELPRATRAAAGLPPKTRDAFVKEVVDVRPAAKALVEQILGE